MPRTWTSEQAASLAPDAASLKTAQGVASPRKWTLLGRDDDFVWGLAQGSGAQPYQVQIDLSEPAFKCSCPSRKFPCKHGLGLLLLFAGNASAVPAGEKPEWVSEWAAKRAQKTAKQEAKANDPTATAAATPGAPIDSAAQAKRREKRAANVAQGVAFLDGWLRDLARQGLAAAAPASYDFWDGPARRLIDAQAPGLARRVRLLSQAVSGVTSDDAQAIAELGRLYLLTTASQRRTALVPEWQAEIDVQLGWTMDQEELRQQQGVPGPWFVGAQTIREEERVIARTSFLFSGAGDVAKLLEFSHARQPSVATLALGRWIDAELVYFPGVRTLRAILKSPARDAAVAGELRAVVRCDDLLASHAAHLAENPLGDDLPFIVRLTPCHAHDRWWLRDETGATLPIAANFSAPWELLACSGGRAIEIVGTWDGFGFTPMTASAHGVLWDLTPKFA